MFGTPIALVHGVENAWPPRAGSSVGEPHRLRWVPGSLSRVTSEEKGMSNEQLYELADAVYGKETFHGFERVRGAKRRRPTMGRRRGKAPQSFNGMHRRRRRKITW